MVTVLISLDKTYAWRSCDFHLGISYWYPICYSGINSWRISSAHNLWCPKHRGKVTNIRVSYRDCWQIRDFDSAFSDSIASRRPIMINVASATTSQQQHHHQPQTNFRIIQLFAFCRISLSFQTTIERYLYRTAYPAASNHKSRQNHDVTFSRYSSQPIWKRGKKSLRNFCAFMRAKRPVHDKWIPTSRLRIG